ncbi:MAG: lipoprotein signal peptidase [Gammaproteobacteria bacterium]|jgi:signal peptidase II|nr:lipoprotein signal peptidase [Gammaproteobacteria bacterium]
MEKVKRGSMPKENKKKAQFIACSTGLCWLWVAVIVFILDYATKFLAKKYLVVDYAVAVMPGFNLALSFNKGAAFSFLKDQSGWQIWFLGSISIIVSLGILIWLSRLSKRDVWRSIALSLIVGGAVGNLLDRIIQGQVTDFVQLYISHFYWPTFNIADSAICIGAVMLFRKRSIKNYRMA